jgi:hypothetical protein
MDELFERFYEICLGILEERIVGAIHAHIGDFMRIRDYDKVSHFHFSSRIEKRNLYSS